MDGRPYIENMKLFNNVCAYYSLEKIIYRQPDNFAE